MAKINAHGHRQVGPTLFTERVRPAGAYDVETTYYEAWRLRSDGTVQSRIIKSTPTALLRGEESVGREVVHRGSAFRNIGRITPGGADDFGFLKSWLTRKGYVIVKEQYR